MKAAQGALPWLFLLAVCSCYSASLLQEPKPMPPGSIRVAVGAGAGTDALQPTLGVRVGVAPRTELRGKLVTDLQTPRGEVGVNVQVVDGEVLDLMLMPSFFHYDSDDALDEEPGVDLIGFGLPVVLSASLDPVDQYQLFIGPDLRVGKRNGSAWSALGLHFGAAVSGPNDRATFIPECAWLMGVHGRETRDVGASARVLAQGHGTFECSVGVTFGAKHGP